MGGGASPKLWDRLVPSGGRGCPQVIGQGGLGRAGFQKGEGLVSGGGCLQIS